MSRPSFVSFQKYSHFSHANSKMKGQAPFKSTALLTVHSMHIFVQEE
jgi:hypothetical protein